MLLPFDHVTIQDYEFVLHYKHKGPSMFDGNAAGWHAIDTYGNDVCIRQQDVKKLEPFIFKGERYVDGGIVSSLYPIPYSLHCIITSEKNQVNDDIFSWVVEIFNSAINYTTSKELNNITNDQIMKIIIPKDFSFIHTSMANEDVDKLISIGQSSTKAHITKHGIGMKKITGLKEFVLKQ